MWTTHYVVVKRAELDRFFQHINNQDPNIRFTQEGCQDGKLPFLDCLSKIGEDGSISTQVYRKPTHTDHYLQFDSHHPLVHKLGVIRTLLYRADTAVSTPER